MRAWLAIAAAMGRASQIRAFSSSESAYTAPESRLELAQPDGFAAIWWSGPRNTHLRRKT
jgi:hypothetical protein